MIIRSINNLVFISVLTIPPHWDGFFLPQVISQMAAAGGMAQLA
jgi:hypothetical protein